MSHVVSESVLRALASRAAADGARARFVAVAAPPEWRGPREIEADGGAFEIHPCVSALAVRELLADLGGDRGRRVMVLTPLAADELGDEVLARLWKHRVHHPSGWEAARELFRVDEMEPALSNQQWLVDLLVEVAPARGYPPPPAAYLDLDTAWRTLLRFGLRMDTDRPGTEDLLRWGESDAARSALQGRVGRVADKVAAGLVRLAGPVAEHVVRLAAAGRGSDLVPLGLLCDALWSDRHTEGGVDLTTARVRLEGPVGAKGLTGAMARDWGKAALTLVRRAHALSDDTTLLRWLRRAEAILDTDLGAPQLAIASDVLPSAFEQRMKRAGHALRGALDDASEDTRTALRNAVTSVRNHLRASGGVDADRVERLEMAERLVYRLAEEGSGAPNDLADAARAFVADGAWVDRAREVLHHGETIDVLAAAYGTVLERIDVIRHDHARQFAGLLASWSAVEPTDRAPLLPIERVLDDVVVPIARRERVLLLVLDGWSHAEATRLAEDLRKVGWTAHRPKGREHPIVVSALPSVTSVSRTSLLSGRLAQGNQADERTNWGEHEGLRGVSRKAPARLFHRRNLGASGGHVAPEVRDAVLDPDVQVVGVVVNALDEHLDKGGQLRLADGLQGIRPLRPLLDAALEAGRVVVLASDHGHVLEFGSKVARYDEAAERWRPHHPPATDDEVVLRGPRVLFAGRGIVVPATERLRYISIEKRGYHGGATPQEVLCPLLVIAPPSTDVPGWERADALPPSWWDVARALGRTPAADEVALSMAPPAASVRTAVDPGGQGRLFGEEPPGVDADLSRETTTGPAWLAALLRSDMLEAQRALAGRAALGDDDLVAFLKALDHAGGVLPAQALAEALAIPMSRVFSKLAALQKTVNVDGYTVVSVEGQRTIRFDRACLVSQFGLEA